MAVNSNIEDFTVSESVLVLWLAPQPLLACKQQCMDQVMVPVALLQCSRACRACLDDSTR